MHRIDTLLIGIDVEYRSNLLGAGMKQNGIKSIFNGNAAHGPQGFGANVLGRIGLFGNVQRIMHLDIEGKLFDALFVIQV